MLFKRLLASLTVFADFARVSFQIAYGVWKLSRLPQPRVTIFGGSKIDLSHPYALQAMELAQKLVDNKISVLTGGGPGIMQSANCGAISENSNPIRSMGIGVKGLDDQALNKCVQELVLVKYFYARKWLLTQYSDGFAIFPGGFGTMDELMEVATLMQTGFLGIHPIVLINTEYWKPFLDWVNNSALKNGLLKDKDKNLLFVTDDIDQAVEVLKKSVASKVQMGM